MPVSDRRVIELSAPAILGSRTLASRPRTLPAPAAPTGESVYEQPRCHAKKAKRATKGFMHVGFHMCSWAGGAVCTLRSQLALPHQGTSWPIGEVRVQEPLMVTAGDLGAGLMSANTRSALSTRVDPLHCCSCCGRQQRATVASGVPFLEAVWRHTHTIRSTL